jgi:hypothetical protein
VDPLPEQIAVTRFVATPPAVVLALITDITRIGDWSPECYRAEWLADAAAGRSPDASRPRPGDRFRGWNQRDRLHWSTVCEVRRADAAHFAFGVVEGAVGRRTEWAYDIQPASGGCLVTEVCRPLRIRPTPAQWVFRRLVVERLRGRTNRAEELADAMRLTLDALANAAEAAAPHR